MKLCLDINKNFIKLIKIKIPDFISATSDHDWLFNYDRLIVNHQPSSGNQMWTRMSHSERIKLNQESIKDDNYNVLTIQSHHRKSNASNQPS